MSLREELFRQRDTVRAFAAKHGATNLRLFGSAIRGDECPDSDIDLLVDLAENRGFRDYLALVEELESLLGRRVEVIIARSPQPAFPPLCRGRGAAFVKSDLPYLGHISDSIAAIESYVVDGRDRFMRERLIQDAVIRNFEIIGEAANRLSAEQRSSRTSRGAGSSRSATG